MRSADNLIVCFSAEQRVLHYLGKIALIVVSLKLNLIHVMVRVASNKEYQMASNTCFIS